MMNKIYLPLLFLASPILFAFDHSHQAYTELLQKYVNIKGHSSSVHYQKIKTNDSEKLQKYLDSLSKVSKSEYHQFSSQQKLAFLINAYNAFTIKIIVDHYPLKSIKDIGSLFQSTWKKKFFQLLGEEQNLDGIEHDTIRKNFPEPRIHFACNCASIGCPALPDEAFVAEKLEEQLESAAKNFLADQSRNRFDSKSSKLYLSKIFEWYAGDFGGKEGVKKFVALKMSQDPKIQEQIRKADIHFLDYNWNLNEHR